MDNVNLKEVITAFTKSFEDACASLNKSNAKVTLEEAEFTFDMEVETDDAFIVKDRRKAIKGMQFKKIAQAKSIVRSQNNEKLADKTGNLQVRLTLTNNS